MPHGPDPVLEWTRGTALRAVLHAPDDPAEREEFLAEHATRLRAAYLTGCWWPTVACRRSPLVPLPGP